MVGATGGGGANEPVYSRTSVCHPHATVSYRSVHRPRFPIVPYFCNCRWPLLRIAACGYIVVSLAVYARLVNKGHRSRCGSDTPIHSNSGQICPSVSRETFSVLWQTPPGSVFYSIVVPFWSQIRVQRSTQRPLVDFKIQTEHTHSHIVGPHHCLHGRSVQYQDSATNFLADGFSFQQVGFRN